MNDRVYVSRCARRQALALPVILPPGLFEQPVMRREPQPGHLPERHRGDRVCLDVQAPVFLVRRLRLRADP